MSNLIRLYGTVWDNASVMLRPTDSTMRFNFFPLRND